MPRTRLIVIIWISVIAIASVLRLQNLEERPIHADEATGARLLAERLTGNGYVFNPTHFHGPTLSLTTAPIAKIRKEFSWSELSKYTLRIVPALAGILLVALPLLWRHRIGNSGALLCAAFLASSPLLVYYSRIYIHESLLTLFSILACYFYLNFIEKPTRIMGVACGLSIGLMFATKETFIIPLFSWALGAIGFFYIKHRSSEEKRSITPYLAPTALLATTTALTATLFYSEGFTHIHGIIDAIRTYFVYETTEGHDKHFSYYLHLLFWPKLSLGLIWTEAFILAFALFAWIQQRQSPTVHFLAIATITQICIYSLISYKTPWLMLVPLAHACLLAGYSLHRIERLKKTQGITLSLILLTALAYQTFQSDAAANQYANDTRNPYAYVPTSKNAEALEQWLHALTDHIGQQNLEPIAVVGQGYWPLPWHLRRFDTIGYWTTPTEEIKAYPIIFAMPEQAAEMSSLLLESHNPLPRSLRTHFTITLYLRNDIWEQWIQAPER